MGISPGENIIAGEEGNGEEQTERQPAKFEILEIPPVKPSISPAAKTFICDCCGRNDLSEGEMSRIDSGHLFCSDCLAALRR
jgi:hypothetical protein